MKHQSCSVLDLACRSSGGPFPGQSFALCHDPAWPRRPNRPMPASLARGRPSALLDHETDQLDCQLLGARVSHSVTLVSPAARIPLLGPPMPERNRTAPRRAGARPYGSQAFPLRHTKRKCTPGKHTIFEQPIAHEKKEDPLYVVRLSLMTASLSKSRTSGEVRAAVM